MAQYTIEDLCRMQGIDDIDDITDAYLGMGETDFGCQETLSGYSIGDCLDIPAPIVDHAQAQEAESVAPAINLNELMASLRQGQAEAQPPVPEPEPVPHRVYIRLSTVLYGISCKQHTTPSWDSVCYRDLHRAVLGKQKYTVRDVFKAAVCTAENQMCVATAKILGPAVQTGKKVHEVHKHGKEGLIYNTSEGFIDNDERIEWFTKTDNFDDIDPSLQIESDHIVLVPATCALAMLQAMSLQLNRHSLNAQQLALAEAIQDRLDQTTLLWDPTLTSAPFRGECYEKEWDTTFVFESYFTNRVRYNVEDNRVNKAFRQYCKLNVNEHAAKVEQLVRQSMRNIIVRRARQMYGEVEKAHSDGYQSGYSKGWEAAVRAHEKQAGEFAMSVLF